MWWIDRGLWVDIHLGVQDSISNRMRGDAMERKTLNFVRGAGSTIQLAPLPFTPPKSLVIPRLSPSEMMTRAWRNVGRDIEKAMQNTANDQKQ